MTGGFPTKFTFIHIIKNKVPWFLGWAPYYAYFSTVTCDGKRRFRECSMVGLQGGIYYEQLVLFHQGFGEEIECPHFIKQLFIGSRNGEIDAVLTPCDSVGERYSIPSMVFPVPQAPDRRTTFPTGNSPFKAGSSPSIPVTHLFLAGTERMIKVLV